MTLPGWLCAPMGVCWTLFALGWLCLFVGLVIRATFRRSFEAKLRRLERQAYLRDHSAIFNAEEKP